MKEDTSIAPSTIAAPSRSPKKYKPETFDKDPLKVERYTLDNGLTIYFTPKHDSPRIQTYIAFRAGSKNDPADTTGLAHYMEHMLFKGTDEIGTVDWPKEEKLLNKISKLYETYRNTKGAKEKASIYKEIDALSQEAASYAVPNEYDKLVSTLGAKGTNAYTSQEKTVYINDIPANELEKWCAIESRRFKKLVLRQFHTELETVFEEYNRAWDNDYRKSWKSIYASLYPNHPYGIPIIGKPEHLKNPSMKNIEKFFYSFYRPNNCALILSGDVKPERDLPILEKYFGDWEAGKIPKTKFPKEAPINKIIKTKNKGMQAEHFYMAYRFPGANSRERILLPLLSAVLQNGQAGLFDLNLMQGQKVLEAHSFTTYMADYSQHILFGMPKEGQSMEEVRDLFLAEIERVKKGDFPDWLLQAIVNDKRFQRVKNFEQNQGRGNFLVDHFTLGTDYEKHLGLLDEMEKVSKEELMAFANKYYGKNYAISFKEHGEDKTNKKVAKPPITPIEINRSKKSQFFTEFEKWSSSRLEPKFIDPDEELEQGFFANTNRRWSYARNEENKSFKLYLVYEMGNENNRILKLLSGYWPFMGTKTKSPAEVQQLMFRLGLNMSFSVRKRRSYLMLNGLEKSFKEGIDLLLEILDDAVINEASWKELVMDVLKGREDQKMNKDHILRTAMMNYALYGRDSAYLNSYDKKELLAFDPKKLAKLTKDLLKLPFNFYYYGQQSSSDTFADLLKLNRPVSKKYPKAKKYKVADTKENRVLFFPYEQKQVEIIMLRKQYPLNRDLSPYHHLFNQYFGAGLSSIVFQEIREAQALAYSAYAWISTPNFTDEAHYLQAYIGTQTDKLKEATNSLMRLMHEMPHAQEQFEASRLSAMKNIENDRKSNQEIFWFRQSFLDRGYKSDPRKGIYEKLPTIGLEDLDGFFKEHISGKAFTFLVLGRKEDIDMKLLKSLGKFQQLKPKDIFIG